MVIEGGGIQRLRSIQFKKKMYELKTTKGRVCLKSIKNVHDEPRRQPLLKNSTFKYTNLPESYPGCATDSTLSVSNFIFVFVEKVQIRSVSLGFKWCYQFTKKTF